MDAYKMNKQLEQLTKSLLEAKKKRELDQAIKMNEQVRKAKWSLK